MRLWHPNQLVHGLEGPHGDGQLDGGNFNFRFNINIFFHFNFRPPTTSWRQTTWRRRRRCIPPTCSSWTRCWQRWTFSKDGKVESFKIRTEGVGAPLPWLLQDPAADLEVHLDETWQQNRHRPCKVPHTYVDFWSCIQHARYHIQGVCLLARP